MEITKYLDLSFGRVPKKSTCRMNHPYSFTCPTPFLLVPDKRIIHIFHPWIFLNEAINLPISSYPRFVTFLSPTIAYMAKIENEIRISNNQESNSKKYLPWPLSCELPWLKQHRILPGLLCHLWGCKLNHTVHLHSSEDRSFLFLLVPEHEIQFRRLWRAEMKC